MKRKLNLLMGGWLCVACSLGAPPMKTATTCSSGDLKVEIEVGHFMLTEDPRTNSTVCDGIRNILSNYRDEYSLRFGRQDLTEIPIRIRATEDLRTLGVESPYAVSGHTY